MGSAGPRPPRSFVLALVLPLLLGACSSLAGPAPGQGSAPREHPRVPDPQRLRVSEEEGSPVLTGASRTFAVDPILDSPWARASEMDEKVRDWIDSFQNRESDLMRASLARMGLYRDAVEEELKRKGLPPSLAFLPIVESWYNPRAVSWVGAAGLWQFMPSTARGMGLHVDRLLDERRDPFLSTPPALDYLAELNERFGSWFLALAAYNGGPGRLERILRGRGGSPKATTVSSSKSWRTSPGRPGISCPVSWLRRSSPGTRWPSDSGT